MANYHDARIPLELVHDVFGHTKSLPVKLLMPEVQKCEFHILSDGSAEISWQIRTDYDGTTKLLPPDGPHYDMLLHITEEQALDCIAHSNIADVTPYVYDGGAVFYNGVFADVSNDTIIQLCWEKSSELIMSYICLFKIGGEAQ